METKFTSCEQVQPELMAWLADELPAADKQAMADHLAHCPACQQELHSVQQLWNAMGTLPVPEPSEQFRPAFYQMLAGFQAEEQRRQRWSVAALLEQVRAWWQPAFGIRLAYGVALLCAGLAIGYGVRPTQPVAAVTEASAPVAATTPAATSRQVGLINRLNNPSAVQRLQAVSDAEEMAPNNERVVAALLSTLNQDPNVNVRLATLEVLGGLPDDPMVRQGLVRSLAFQDSPLVQSALADLMVQLQERRSVRSLRKMLQQDNLNEQVKTKIEQSIQSLSHDRSADPSTPSKSHETPQQPISSLDTSVAT